MVSIAKTHSAFTLQSIAAWERVGLVSAYFFIVLYLSTTWSLDSQSHWGLILSMRSLTHGVGKFSDSNPAAPIEAVLSPHDKYSLQYLYWNRLSTIKLFF